MLVTLTPALESSRKDKAYRRYASGIERTLSMFDTALQEWEDYISFLGRLSKVGGPTTTAMLPCSDPDTTRPSKLVRPTSARSR